MYSYNRTKTAAKINLHNVWKGIVDKYQAKEENEFQELTRELVLYLRSVGYELDWKQSWIGKEWHGSDGWRMSGILYLTESPENTVKAETAQQVEKWVTEATGQWGSASKGKLPGEWRVDIGEY
jgi:hypothetical protein